MTPKIRHTKSNEKPQDLKSQKTISDVASSNSMFKSENQSSNEHPTPGVKAGTLKKIDSGKTRATGFKPEDVKTISDDDDEKNSMFSEHTEESLTKETKKLPDLEVSRKMN